MDQRLGVVKVAQILDFKYLSHLIYCEPIQLESLAWFCAHFSFSCSSQKSLEQFSASIVLVMPKRMMNRSRQRIDCQFSELMIRFLITNLNPVFVITSRGRPPPRGLSGVTSKLFVRLGGTVIDCLHFWPRARSALHKADVRLPLQPLLRSTSPAALAGLAGPPRRQ